MATRAFFRAAVKMGNIAELDRLKGSGSLAIKIVRGDDNWALRKAAKYGEVGVLKWLKKEFGLTREDARSKANDAIRMAIIGSVIGVLECLYNDYHLRREDVVPHHLDAIGALECLYSDYHLRREDVVPHHLDAIAMTVEEGNFRLVRCLHHKFRLTVDDIRCDNNQILRCAISSGSVRTVKSVVAFGLSKKDIDQCSDEVWGAATSGNYLLVNYLHLTFKVRVNRLELWKAAGEKCNKKLRKALKHNKFYFDKQQNKHILDPETGKYVRINSHTDKKLGLSTFELLSASEDNNIEKVKSLISKNVNIDSIDRETGQTALSTASNEGHFNIVKYLVGEGVNIHIHDELALRMAAGSGNLSIVKHLVDNGADVQADYNNAIYLASHNDHKKVVGYLKSKGATLQY